MQFWHIFQISLVVLIINCTPSCVITYTNWYTFCRFTVFRDDHQIFEGGGGGVGNFCVHDIFLVGQRCAGYFFLRIYDITVSLILQFFQVGLLCRDVAKHLKLGGGGSDFFLDESPGRVQFGKFPNITRTINP